MLSDIELTVRESREDLLLFSSLRKKKKIDFLFFVIFHGAEDEGLRIRGRRITLSDIIGNGLKWRGFNGSWINGKLSGKYLFSTCVVSKQRRIEKRSSVVSIF